VFELSERIEEKYMLSNNRNTILDKRIIMAITAGIAIAGILSIYYFGPSTALNNESPNGAPLTSGSDPRVTISIKGLSEKPYIVNETVSFQAKVNGELAHNNCGDIHLVAGRAKSDDNNTQVSSWNATLPCISLTSKETARINFEHLYPTEDTAYSFTPKSSGSYIITATVSTKSDGMYVTSRTFQVIKS
jgi:hypothetical protein